jgi:hypothetical protein
VASFAAMKRPLLAAVLAAATLLAPAASAAPRHPRPAPAASTLAVIGDVPYGDAQIAGFPRDIAEINADPEVSRVIHLGDIKNGSSRCDTEYFRARLADFQTFADPLVYTPGDNEWTDCHRANNGGYLPTERLDVLREIFLPPRPRCPRRAARPRCGRASSPPAAPPRWTGSTRSSTRRSAAARAVSWSACRPTCGTPPRRRRS